MSIGCKEETLADGRAVPRNSRELWKKIPPDELYRLISTTADPEAWNHLHDLIYVLLIPQFSKPIVKKRGISIDDQVRHTLCHILNKIRQGTLWLDEPVKFFGLLKIITANCLADVLRKPSMDDRAESFEGNQSTLDVPYSHDVAQEAEISIFTRKVWAAMKKCGLSDKQKRALELSWAMQKGLIDLKNNYQLSERLSREFGEPVSYEEAGQLIYRARQKLINYFRTRGY